MVKKYYFAGKLFKIFGKFSGLGIVLSKQLTFHKYKTTAVCKVSLFYIHLAFIKPILANCFRNVVHIYRK